MSSNPVCGLNGFAVQAFSIGLYDDSERDAHILLEQWPAFEVLWVFLAQSIWRGYEQMRGANLPAATMLVNAPV